MSHPDSRFRRPLDSAKTFLAKRTAFQDVYDKDYFETTIESFAVPVAPVIAESVITRFHPRSLVDVGCGTGAILEQFQKRGVRCTGLEYADAAIAKARSRSLQVIKLDLTQKNSLDLIADLSMSLEVAEHLPQAIADPFVDLLCTLAPTVLMTAAPPGQGGTGHLNEQPNEYWIAKFQSRGFQLDQESTDAFRQQWREADVAGFYHQNVLVFRKAAIR
jgi:SAM-dependent methyltransferase